MIPQYHRMDAHRAPPAFIACPAILTVLHIAMHHVSPVSNSTQVLSSGQEPGCPKRTVAPWLALVTLHLRAAIEIGYASVSDLGCTPLSDPQENQEREGESSQKNSLVHEFPSTGRSLPLGHKNIKSSSPQGSSKDSQNPMDSFSRVESLKGYPAFRGHYGPAPDSNRSEKVLSAAFSVGSENFPGRSAQFPLDFHESDAAERMRGPTAQQQSRLWVVGERRWEEPRLRFDGVPTVQQHAQRTIRF